MNAAEMCDRLDAMIDELIMDGGVDAASLASILLAAKDSVRGRYSVTLSQQIWFASNDLYVEDANHDPMPLTSHCRPHRHVATP